VSGSVISSGRFYSATQGFSLVPTALAIALERQRASLAKSIVPTSGASRNRCDGNRVATEEAKERHADRVPRNPRVNNPS